MNAKQELLQRALMLMFVAGMEVIGSWIMPLVSRDEAYWLIATVFNLFMYLFVSRMFVPTDMVLDVKVLLIAQALVQLMGLSLYKFDQFPQFYNICEHWVVKVTYVRIVLGSSIPGFFFPDRVWAVIQSYFSVKVA